MTTILIRADGKKSLGMGHIIRCIGLADALKEQLPAVSIIFFTKYEDGLNIIQNHGYQVIQIHDNDIEVMKKYATSNSVIITDFLDTDNAYIKKIKQAIDCPVICIDNNTSLKNIESDIVINANVLDRGETLVKGDTRYYLGIKYMILRKEFAQHHESKIIHEKVRSILISLVGQMHPD